MAAITVESLTKRFGSITAVDALSFTVEPGRVTGFLGRNGAGKTTTLRTVLGLSRPTAGRAFVLGRPYVELDEPARRVGALLETNSFYPGRRACDHLLITAAMAGIAARRVDHVLEEVGLAAVSRRRIGGFSLGMRQRLGLATALLGDPDVLILDEPTNGLDPDGITWLRRLLRHRADRGCAVLISSHVLAEVANSVDDVVIIDRGRLLAAQPVAELLNSTRSLEDAFFDLTGAPA